MVALRAVKKVVWMAALRVEWMVERMVFHSVDL
jgi:hypothetical protein